MPRSLSNNRVRHRCSPPRRASLTSLLGAKESSSSSPHNNKNHQSILRIQCGGQERSNSSSTKKALKELPKTENILKKREAISARSSSSAQGSSRYYLSRLQDLCLRQQEEHKDNEGRMKPSLHVVRSEVEELIWAK